MPKILIAEDDKFLQAAYRAKFSKEGFELDIAADGEEALSKIESFKPDVLLLDLMMPKKDGFAVLTELKAKGSSMPVIVASNLGQKEDLDKAMGLGARDFVVKSDLALEDLIKKIRTHLPK